MRVIAEPLDNAVPFLLHNSAVESQTRNMLMIETGLDDIKCSPPRRENDAGKRSVIPGYC